MLTRNQLKEWFESNGIGLAVPFPKFLLNARFFKRALGRDEALFHLLPNAFEFFNENLLILKFYSWNELFECYTSYVAGFSA